MLNDGQLFFGEDQVFTADADSTNILDLGSAKANDGGPLFVVIKVATAFDNLTNIDFLIRSSATAGGSYATIASQVVLLAALTLDATAWVVALPPDTLQFVKLNYDITGSAPSVGAITAFLTTDPDTAL